VITERGISVASPTTGAASELVFEQLSGGDATSDIFGITSPSFQGSAPTKARLAATPVLTKHGGVDVRAQNILLLALDGGAVQEIDLRSAASNIEELQSLSLDKLVQAINEPLHGVSVASTDGQRILLASPTTGGISKLEVLPLETIRERRFVTRALVTDEAARSIFGFLAKDAQGTPPTSARVTGAPDLSQSADLQQERFLRLTVDGSRPVEIDCAGGRPRATTLSEIVTRINAELVYVGFAKGIAVHDGKHLLLISPSSGSGSRIAIEPPRVALETLLGIEPGTFRGTDETQVSFTSTVDLSEGIDLEPEAAIKLGVDGEVPTEIVLGDPAQPHRSLFALADAINTALKVSIASSGDGRRIELRSAKKGTGSKIVFETPSGHDVTKAIFGITPSRTYVGDAATAARVEGRHVLHSSVDVSGFRFLRLSVDGDPSVDIDCFAQANHRAISDRSLEGLKGEGLPVEVLEKLKGIKDQDVEGEKNFLELVSTTIGDEPAAAFGSAILKHAAKRASLQAIVQAIDQAVGTEIASISPDGKHLVLHSELKGATGELRLEAHRAGDARQRLLGDAPAVTSGTPSVPAIIIGDANLLSPVNLSSRRLLRIAVDGGRPVDIDVAGAVPAQTFLDEIVANINRVLPRLAAATDDDRLQLMSPGAGARSSLSVQPLRHLEVQEYLLREATPRMLLARHHDSWSIVNDGVADTSAKVTITAPQGTVGPTLVNSTLGWSARLFVVLEHGETANLWHDARLGLQAEVISAEGKKRPIPKSKILVGPLGAQAFVPFTGTWSLAGEGRQSATLQLNNPQATAIVLLQSRQPRDEVTVSAVESDITSPSTQTTEADGNPARLVGRVKRDKEEFHLVDAGGAPIAQLFPGAGANLRDYQDYVVAVAGPLHPGTPPQMLVQKINRLFDVTLCCAPGSKLPEEKYPGVTIGVGATGEDSLVYQINAGTQSVPASKLVRAEEFDQATVLSLPVGKTVFRYLDCLGSRFEQARFNRSRFPDGVCGERGIFDVSRFTHAPPERIKAVFASADPLSDPPVKIDFRWEIFQAGAFVVNLPADLPARFGARFNETRFGQSKDAPELYEGAVTEPETDENFLVKLISPSSGDKSNFVKATVAPTVDLGWSAVKLPFRKPQFLTLGRPGQAARLYLKEDGLDGFIKLEAREAGVWGNEIAVTARQVGPAIYDVSVIYRGGRFESARSIVLRPPLGELTKALLQPSPIGVLQAKAAGVKADVTRDRAEYKQSTVTP
jgi:hypothetical protein